MSTLRVVKGSPTQAELAALAVVIAIVTRRTRTGDVLGPAAPDWRPRSGYRPPGAWASR